MSNSPSHSDAGSYSSHGYSNEMHRKQKKCVDELNALPKGNEVPPNVEKQVPIPWEKQTSSQNDIIFCDPRSHYTSESYKCTDGDCDLGSNCCGQHSYSNEVKRNRFGIVPEGKPPAHSDYWPLARARRYAKKWGLPRTNLVDDPSDSGSNGENTDCCSSAQSKPLHRDSDEESQS